MNSRALSHKTARKGGGRGQNRKDHWLQMAIGWSVGPYRHYLNLPQNRTWRGKEKKGGNTCFPAKGVFLRPRITHADSLSPPFLKPCMTLFRQQKRLFFGAVGGAISLFLGGEGGGDWRPYSGGGGGRGKGHSKRYRKGREREERQTPKRSAHRKSKLSK